MCLCIRSAGWYDNYVESDLDAFTSLSSSTSDNRIMIGPWAHTFNTPFPGVNFGKAAAVPLRPEQLRWFDRWLKGKPESEPVHPVRIFVMGIDKWRDEDEWPLSRARDTKFYLSAQTRANSIYGDGALGDQADKHAPADTFVYDPNKPVPTTGGAVCCNNRIFPWGPMDQRAVEKRHDVLVYSSRVLPSDVEVTGPIKVVLFASSTAPDTDFTAKLVDVFPTGEARNLTDGILRVRYRDSLERPKLMTPGEVYQPKYRRRCDKQCVSRGAPNPTRDFEQQFPAFRPKSEYRTRRSRTKKSCGKRRRRYITTERGTRICCCR